MARSFSDQLVSQNKTQYQRECLFGVSSGVLKLEPGHFISNVAMAVYLHIIVCVVKD